MRKSSAFSHARRLAVSVVLTAARERDGNSDRGISSMIFSRFSATGDVAPC
jgi:hypothetical protein